MRHDPGASTWWTTRRDDLLAQLAALLVHFGTDVLKDPGIGELADTASVLAGEYRASEHGEPIRTTAVLLQEAATELQNADRFRATLLPVVCRHLRRAVALLVRARTDLETSVPAGGQRAGAREAR
ncbi:hypothetical protein ACWEQL_36390 [Kitasatospora sp. NPDC004240]